MSQKKEKYARNLDRRVTVVEQRLDQLEIFGVDTANEEAFSAADAFEEHLLRARYTAECKENARNKAHADRRMRRILEAEEAARSWKVVAYAALVAAIIVLIIAIVAVKAEAAELVQQENELMISDAETMTHSEDDAKNTPIFVMSLEQIEDSYENTEDFENEKIEAALLERATEIQSCTVTHYCICKECCGKDPDHPAYGITASGLRANPYVSVAVDPDVIPLGSDVLVDYGDGELHYYRADDTGSAVKGDHIDVCVSSHEEAQQLGITTATVYYAAPEEV